MTTMKSFTDLPQSKILSKILRPESADMFYCENGIDAKLIWEHNAHKVKYPCWSLAALLEEIPEIINFDDDESDYELKIEKENNLYYLSYGNILEHGKIEIEPQENFVDACYEMIIRLNKLKML